RKIGDDPLGPVGHEDRHMIALAQAERMQALGEGARLVAQLRISVARAPAHQCLAGGKPRRLLIEQVRHGATRGHPGHTRKHTAFPGRRAANYSGRICTSRNFTTPAPYCSAMRPVGSLASSAPSTVRCPLSVTVNFGPLATIS